MHDEQLCTDQGGTQPEALRQSLVTGKRIAPVHLTPRESQIVRFVVLGESNKQIARRLGISDYTVRDHVSNLLRKAGATKRSRLGVLLPIPAVPSEPAVPVFERSIAMTAMPHEGRGGPTALRPGAGTRWLRGTTES